MRKINYLSSCVLAVFMLFLSESVVAQSVILSPDVIASSGAYSENAGFSLSYTVGEMTMVATVAANNVILTQGFQQPEPIEKSIVSSSDGITLYPNPANDWFKIDYSFPNSGDLELLVYDVRGRLVNQQASAPYLAGLQGSLTISGIDWAAGVYVVRAKFTANDGSGYTFPYAQKLEVIH